jgi:thymidine kinase
MNTMPEGVKGKGRLEVVCGSMFSGKTEELMRRLRRAEFAKQHVLTVKHHIDKRYNKVPTCIVSHEGRERFAFVVTDAASDYEKIIELAHDNIDVVGIDELHFYGPTIIEVIEKLVESGKRVLVAGLDLDFRGEPFALMSRLLSIADDVLKLKAICVVCGSEAHHTQRLINGKPAAYDDPIILVGASEFYEARCRNCFSMNKPTKPLYATTHKTRQTTPRAG